MLTIGLVVLLGVGCASGSVQNGDADGSTGPDAEADTGVTGRDTAPRDSSSQDTSDARSDADGTDGDIADVDGADGGGDTADDADAGPCGGCAAGQACREGRCVDVCASTQAECGSVILAGETVDCGTCSSGSFCAQNTCRSICVRAGAECGEVFWGGRTTNCGSCSSGTCFHNRCASSGYRSISAGSRHTCATDAGGEVSCWGRDAEEQLGNGTDGASKTPVAVPVSGLQVRAGPQHACSASSSGSASCWGLNNKGQVGSGSTDLLVASPETVDGLTGAVDLGAGRLHACAVLQTGRIECWGAEVFGRLGNGKSGQRSRRTPVQVENLTDAVEVVAGGSHSCAIDANGAVWCWGNGSQGRLGNGGFSGSSTPVRVSNIEHAVDIAAGVDHTCAATRDGRVWCWGHGGDHQLGNGETGNRAVPVEVQGLTSAVAVAAGEKHSCARTSQDEAYCWGSNSTYNSGDLENGGQLGDGSYQDAKSPVQVAAPGGGSSLPDIMTIAAGSLHTCAVTTDGRAYCWGDNDAGQLGDGGTSLQNTPTRVQ